MTVENQVRVAGFLWLIIGVLTLIRSVGVLRPDRNVTWAETQGDLIFLAFGTSFILGAFALLKRKLWGRLLVLANSTTMLLYSTAFLLFVGGEYASVASVTDRVIIGALVVLSAFSLFRLGPKRSTSSYFAT